MPARDEALRRALLLVTALAGVACGPVQSTAVLMDTETMLAAARTAQADKVAPYEWTAATLYFAKAKEVANFSRYELAATYGKQALDFATRARDVAVRSGRKVEAPDANGGSPR